MLERCVVTLLTVTIGLSLAPQTAAQSSERTIPMRTPDGQPDISGIFTFRTLTPYARPEQFEGRETLTAEEAAEFEASERRRQNRDLFDPELGANNYRPRSEGGVLSYNEFWYKRGIDLTDDKRTALIIDPPDGRLPPRVPQTEDPQRVQLSEKEAIARRYDSYENRSMMDRCIMGFNAGPPMASGAYNNNVMIFQTADHVVILNEMVHNARVIPIDDVARPPCTQFSGVSRGHWEGETFVVETTNFRGGESRGTSPNKHLIEKFTRPTQTGLPTSTRSPTRRCTRPPSPSCCRSAEPTDRCSSTRVMKATSDSTVFSPARASSNGRVASCVASRLVKVAGRTETRPESSGVRSLQGATRENTGPTPADCPPAFWRLRCIDSQ